MKYGILFLLLVTAALWTGCAERGSGQSFDEPADAPLPDTSPADATPATTPVDAEIAKDQARCMAEARKWVKEAEGLLEDALKTQKAAGHKVGFLRPLIVVQGKTGDKEAAMENFERAFELIRTTPNIDVMNALGGLRLSVSRAGLEEQAEKSPEWVEWNTKRYNGFYFILRRCSRIKDYTEAERMARKLDREVYYCAIANEQAHAGLWADAAKTGESLLPRSPKYALLVYCYMARYMVERGEKAAAEKAFARAREIAKDIKSSDLRGESYALIAVSEARQKLFAAAEKDLEKAGPVYCRHDAAMMLAEFHYEKGRKKQALEYLEKAKRNVRGFERVDGKVRGLCEIAVLESKMIDKEKARETIKEARKAYDERGKGLPSFGANCLAMEPRYILRAEFEAGLHEEMMADARTFGRDDEALMEIVLCYGEVGDFKKAHEIMRLISDKGKGIDGTWSFYHGCIRSMAEMEIKAGVTEYASDIVADLKKAADPVSTNLIKGRFLAGLGLEKRLQEEYASMKDARARYHFCLGAAEGFLMRADDLKNRSKN